MFIQLNCSYWNDLLLALLNLLNKTGSRDIFKTLSNIYDENFSQKKLMTIFTKKFIIDVRLGSKYASGQKNPIFLRTSGIIWCKWFCCHQNWIFECLATCFECYLSSLVQALFSLKVIVFFLFKIYIKQSQIWDTLPTFKIEIFVTIVICTVILAWYCTHSIALWVSFLCQLVLVPFHSRWFHLKISEMLLFVTIAIANVVFFWAMVFHTQFLPMNLFFMSVQCWVNLVPGGSSWFQLIHHFSMYNFYQSMTMTIV